MCTSRTGVCLLMGALLQWTTGCAGKSDSSGSDEAAQALVEVRVAAVAERALSDRLPASGQWRAANEMVVTAPFSAVVESLGPRPGDHVLRGETLGSLVTRESRAALRGAELMLRQATDPAAREEARGALELAQHDLVKVPLVAATSGVVVRRAAESGSEVAEGAELLRIVAERDLVFEAHVALEHAGRVVVGQPATIALEGGGTIRAVVQRRLPSTSASDQSALVWLSPVASVPADVLDRFGTASIEVGVPRRVVAVPDSAMVADDLTGEIRIARVDSTGVAVWTVIRLGAASDGWHELVAPRLRPGTMLVVSGQRGLPDSTRVRVRT